MKKAHQGYTLIELLLVISLITLGMTVSINLYRHHQRKQRIEKVALEMQTFIQAALNYASDYNHWPTTNFSEQSTCDPEQDNEFIRDYAPNQSPQSPLGSNYCWSSLGNKQQLFWVALNTPTGDMNFARHLAALLPNAVVTQNPAEPTAEDCDSQTTCYVRLEVTRSTGNSSSTSSAIVGVGNCIPGQNPTQGSNENMQCQYKGSIGSEPKTVRYAVSFECPVGMQGNLVANVNFMDVGQAKRAKNPYTLRSLAASSSECKSRDNQNGKNQVTCILAINAARANGDSVATGAHGKVGATYSAYCIPQKHHQQTFTF